MKQNWPKKQWILGHRGARIKAPENTISAFKKAMVLGADGVELDVFLSKDNELVVIHDPTVDRTTDKTGTVSSFTAKELWFLNAAAKLFPEHPKDGVPRLQRVLDCFTKDAIVNIEIKSDPDASADELISRLLETIQGYSQKLKIIISSFDFGLLLALRKRAPESLIALLLGTSEVDVSKLRQSLNSIQPDALHLSNKIASPLLIALAKQNQLRVGVWTVNDPVRARTLFSYGVDGIFTDDVQKIVSAIQSS